MSAAISSGVYTITSGSNANAAGAIGAAISGGLSAGIGAGVAGAGLGAASSAGLVFGGTAGSDILGSDVTAAIKGTKPDVKPTQVLIDATLSAATFGAGGRIAEELGLSSVGRPATSMETLTSSFFDPAEHPRAAYQVYSGIADTGINAGIQAFGSISAPILNQLRRISMIT
ncbi:MAG: hypothetical protein M1587_07910 [Thaumarchaeota archaeon]|nr:hypothetical protein [Nitrososphaerota archaeon]